MVDCNACNYNPKPWQLDKIKKKQECWAIAGSMDDYFLKYVIGYCANYPGRMDKREEIGQAIDLLLSRTNFFTRAEFEQVEIRWCKIEGKLFGRYEFGASGMVPEQNKILLDVSVQDVNVETLAVLIAHEMKHIKQYNDWDKGPFRCEYMSELLKGHGFRKANWVEREAYDFQDKVAGIIYGRGDVAENAQDSLSSNSMASFCLNTKEYYKSFLESSSNAIHNDCFSPCSQNGHSEAYCAWLCDNDDMMALSQSNYNFHDNVQSSTTGSSVLTALGGVLGGVTVTLLALHGYNHCFSEKSSYEAIA